MTDPFDIVRAIPTPPLPIVFALSWLWGVLTVEIIKTSKTKATRAIAGLSCHCAFWAIGLVFVLEHFR